MFLSYGTLFKHPEVVEAFKIFTATYFSLYGVLRSNVYKKICRVFVIHNQDKKGRTYPIVRASHTVECNDHPNFRMTSNFPLLSF